jgi:hypothetical protein
MLTLTRGVPGFGLLKRWTIELPGEPTGVVDGLSKRLGRETLKRTWKKY